MPTTPRSPATRHLSRSFCQCFGGHRDLHSFPTRRSSDLPPPRSPAGRRPRAPTCGRPSSRSEEHTSELQSHVNLVCRLLLEKKKEPLNAPLVAEHLADFGLRSHYDSVGLVDHHVVEPSAS